MPKIDVIKFERTSDTEIHIYPPDNGDTWWARLVPKYLGDGEVWELNDGDGDNEGYFADIEPMLQYVSEHFDDAPVVEKKKRDDW